MNIDICGRRAESRVDIYQMWSKRFIRERTLGNVELLSLGGHTKSKIPQIAAWMVMFAKVTLYQRFKMACMNLLGRGHIVLIKLSKRVA